MGKKKKRIIIASILVGVIVSLLLLSSAVFQIRSVSVQDQTRLTYLSKPLLNQMIEEAEMPIGSSIFFARFDDNVKAMEKAYPYVKINGVERKFPSDVVVYVSERVPVVKVVSGGKYYVLDSDLKILNIAANASAFITETAEKDVPELIITAAAGFKLELNGLEKGDFVLGANKIKEYVSAFYNGAVFSSLDDRQEALSCITMIKSIKVDYIPELGKMAFHLEYNDTNITSTIEGETELTDTIYKMVAAVNHAVEFGEDVSYINAKEGKFYIGRN